MKISTLCSILLLSSMLVNAQTWTGNTSTDWNTGTNWSGNAVPLANANVTIPTTPAGSRWPKLAAATTVNNFTMAAGAELDVNGFVFTANAAIDLKGTINNTKPATDITFMINGAGTSFLRNLTVNDNITYNINGAGTFYDTYLANTANSYNGNVSYLRNGAGAIYVAYYSRNTYGGNVEIKSTVALTNESFLFGSDITGNLTIESVGGITTIGALAHATKVDGTLNISGTTSGVFYIRRIINQQNGGSINLANRSTIDIQADTIRVNAINISEHSAGLDLSRNSITGNIVYSSANATSGTSFVRNNIITGTASFTINGASTFYDTYLANTANSYSGNVSYLRNGAGGIYVAYYSRNIYGGNVEIKSTVALTNESFLMGSDITGNLTVESVGGITTIGALAHATKVGGTLNISGTTSGVFYIRRIINQQNGGIINLANRSTIDIQEDTIRVNAINISEQTGGLDLSRNSIIGNIVYSNTNAAGSITFVRNNMITGDASFTLNGTQAFYDSYLANTANSYNGNVSYLRNGTGTTYISNFSRNTYVGNVLIKATVASTMEAFNFGADITGNLSVESVGGNATIGTLAHATKVSGILNLSGTTSGVFHIKRILNQQNGGSITLTGRSNIDIQNDTIQVNILNIAGHTGGLDLWRSSIIGNITYSNANEAASTLFVRNNIIQGNASYNLHGTATFYDTYLSNTSNNYSGNVSYIRNGTGPLYVGYYDTVYIGGNLTFNYSSPGTVDNRFIAFQGTGPSILRQDGALPLQLQRLSVYKTGAGNLSLNDSLIVSNNVYFAGGNIVTANQKELILLTGATATGANDASKVVGPLVKIGAQAFSFPIGGPSHLQGVRMTAPVGVSTRFRAEYVQANPHPTYDTAQRTAGLARMSTCEYWRVDREIGATNVTLTFDYGNPCACVEVPANLRVARWSGSQWTNLGNGGTTGNVQGGTVQTAAGVADYGIFTLGTSATVTPAISITRNVANPVCVCRKVTFTANATLVGCNPTFQWKKNSVNVGTNSATYEDSALVNGDVITSIVTSSAAFSQPATQTSNSFSITTTDLTNWTGTANTNWHNAANWSCQSVPCTLSKVAINGPTPNACEIQSGNVTVISLTANSNSIFRVLAGATLELKQP